MAKQQKVKSDFLFTVLRNGKPLMSTNYESCIPSKEELRDMKKLGFTFIDNRKNKREIQLSVIKS